MGYGLSESTEIVEAANDNGEAFSGCGCSLIAVIVERGGQQ
jgi:hypothetical protein